MMKRSKTVRLRSGDHIRVFRGLYWHHGIYIGRGRVIHFVGEPLAKSGACVRTTSLKRFLDRGAVEVVAYEHCLSRRQSVRRARSCLGAGRYDLLMNNCEHLARWCKTGSARSGQVEWLTRQPLITNAAARAAVRIPSMAGSLLPSSAARLGLVAARLVPILNVASTLITGGLVLYQVWWSIRERAQRQEQSL